MSSLQQDPRWSQGPGPWTHVAPGAPGSLGGPGAPGNRCDGTRGARHTRHLGYRHFMRHARRRIFMWLVVAITLTLFVGHRIAQHGGTHRPWVVPVVVLCVLWFVAHKVAASLARPLDELARSADRMGRGTFVPSMNFTRRAPVEVLRVASALRSLGERIEQQTAEQKALLASVSHELRSPLARVRLLSELLRDEPTGASRLKHLEALDLEVNEIDQLVGSLLQGARLDFRNSDRVPLDLEVLLKRVCVRAEVHALVQVQGTAARVLADPSLIARALENITENARHYGAGADLVQMVFDAEAGGAAGGVSVWVHDQGPGLPEGDPAQIFALFFRKGGSEHGGLGLGLTLVERIVRAHGGEVRAERRPGGGASVGFWLPTVEQE